MAFNFLIKFSCLEKEILSNMVRRELRKSILTGKIIYSWIYILQSKNRTVKEGTGGNFVKNDRNVFFPILELRESTTKIFNVFIKSSQRTIKKTLWKFGKSSFLSFIRFKIKKWNFFGKNVTRLNIVWGVAGMASDSILIIFNIEKCMFVFFHKNTLMEGIHG